MRPVKRRLRRQPLQIVRAVALEDTVRSLQPPQDPLGGDGPANQALGWAPARGATPTVRPLTHRVD